MSNLQTNNLQTGKLQTSNLQSDDYIAAMILVVLLVFVLLFPSCADGFSSGSDQSDPVTLAGYLDLPDKISDPVISKKYEHRQEQDMFPFPIPNEFVFNPKDIKPNDYIFEDIDHLNLIDSSSAEKNVLRNIDKALKVGPTYIHDPNTYTEYADS